MFSKVTVFKALTNHKPRLLPDTINMAAVMIILLLAEDEKSIEIVLTKRASSLATYAGHVSFPGGMKEKDDKDLLTTAKREVLEELNLPVTAYQMLGELDDFQDRFGDLVRPFISWMLKIDFVNLHRIDPVEVSDLIYFPLNKLTLIHDDPTLHSITKRRPSYVYRENDIYLWGLTASILVHLLDVIHLRFSPFPIS